MNDYRKIPLSLKIVAILFILGGITATIEMLVALTHNRISFNFGVLGFFIGPGLLALRPGWRTCALVFIWIGLIIAPLFILLMLGHSGAVDFKVLGAKIGHVPRGIALMMAIIEFLICFWQYRVLTHPDIRVLFIESIENQNNDAQ